MKQPVQFRAASFQPSQQTTTSFASDIMPIFKQFQGPMMWRFDLTSYDAVKTNASTIYSRISSTSSPMPPPPFPPLSAAQIATFKQWMDEGYPP